MTCTQRHPYRHSLSSRTLQQLVNLRMGTNPDPERSVFAGLDREDPVAQSDSHRPEPPDPFEVQGGVARIIAELRIGTISLSLHGCWQTAVAAPEPWTGLMLHRSRHRPAARSARASSANQSSAPSSTSCTSCRSQSAASKRSNQALEAVAA